MVQLYALKRENLLPAPVIQDFAQTAAFRLDFQYAQNFTRQLDMGMEAKGNEIKKGLEDAFEK